MYVVEPNPTYNKISPFEQNLMFDHQTVDYRTQSRVQLPNSQKQTYQTKLNTIGFDYV